MGSSRDLIWVVTYNFYIKYFEGYEYEKLGVILLNYWLGVIYIIKRLGGVMLIKKLINRNLYIYIILLCKKIYLKSPIFLIKKYRYFSHH